MTFQGCHCEEKLQFRRGNPCVPYTPMFYKKSLNLLILLKNLLNLRMVDNALRTGEKRISKGNEKKGHSEKNRRALGVAPKLKQRLKEILV